MSVPQFLQRWFGSLLLGCTLAGSLGLNVYFADRLRAEKARHSLPLTGLRVGDSLEGLSVFDPDVGQIFLFKGARQAETLLYVFSPRCSWCMKNHPNILALYQQLGHRLRFVALATDKEGLEAFLHVHSFPFPVVRLPADSQKTDSFRVTPQTVLVDVKGRVTSAWDGGLIGRRQEDVQNYFGVSLPGITQ